MSSNRHASPLRYPGGKSILYEFLAEVIEDNGLEDGVYAEVYAGGAGAALKLLFSDHVESIIINDADPCIYNFWSALLENPGKFADLIENTPVSIDEWYIQREIYLSPAKHSKLRVGFATFYLNRCNRSGILQKGGPIGGYEQTGKWLIDARFNKIDLIKRIEKILMYKDRILATNLDAIDFLTDIIKVHPSVDRMFVYLDPPYYVKGSSLYMNHYLHDDHVELADFMRSETRFKWVMSYDNCAQINQLYLDHNRISFNLAYSAHTAKIGSELLIYNDAVVIREQSRALPMVG
ncbi:MAG: DNA adenine methylase [Pseudohongiella sp.]|nr:DNA adenine methylase [Pseudohongiella sp.]